MKIIDSAGEVMADSRNKAILDSRLEPSDKIKTTVTDADRFLAPGVYRIKAKR